MRTYFEPEEADEFEAAQDLLIRRCTAWASRENLETDAFWIEAALDFRHAGDGRLGHWTGALVEEFLLTFAPRTLSVTAAEAADGPEALRTFLRYLHAMGLDSPLGDSLAALEAAISSATNDFAQAMTEERNFGLTKFWVMKAINSGIDPHDEIAMQRFVEDTRAGRVAYDESVLGEIVSRGPLDQKRSPGTLPVALATPDEIAAEAAESKLVRQLREFTEWVGEAGRPLTTGRQQLKLADARELVDLLGTGDVIDPDIGGKVYRTSSSEELSTLSLIFRTATKVRLVRVVKGRLVQVAKSKRLLGDPLALWDNTFDALPRLGGMVLGVSRYLGPSMFCALFEELVPDILNTVYGSPEPVPITVLEMGIWSAFEVYFGPEDPDAADPQTERASLHRDLQRMLRTFADLGAVRLHPDQGSGTSPIERVELTPLGTNAVHARQVAAGRYAPVIGELSGAGAAQLLGTIAEHYHQEAGREEISRWLAAHGGAEAGLEQLLDAVRACPFHSRASAMLGMLSDAWHEDLLHGLRKDERIGSIATHLLLGNGELQMEELTEEQVVLGFTEQLLALLEIAGPDEVSATLPNVPPPMLSAMVHSGQYETESLRELRALIRASRPAKKAKSRKRRG